MRCAIYCRLSREDEERQLESESIQNQKSLLLAHASHEGWEVAAVYCDEDYSGADSSRPAFREMLAGAEVGAFDLILCKTQSRFTRDMELVERYIHGLFPLWGIRFVAVADHVDTGLRGNKKARQINGLVNEWYLEDLSENIRMVLDHKRSQGRHIGGFSLFGYRKSGAEKGRLEIDPPAAHLVREIFSLALSGYSAQDIAGLLNARGIPNPAAYKREQGLRYRNGGGAHSGDLWSRATVSRILRNEMYLGTMVQGTHRRLGYKSKKLLSVPQDQWFRVEGTHEAIIDRAVFAQVQALRPPRRKKAAAGVAHPLSGLVRCLHCGSLLHRNFYDYKGKRYTYLRCPKRDGQGRRHPDCTASVPLDALVRLVEAPLRRYLALWCAPFSSGAAAEAAPEILSSAAEEEARAGRRAILRKAISDLYLDKASGLLTPTQFQLLVQDLTRELEALTPAPKKEKAGEAHTPDAALISNLAERLSTAPLPSTLFFTMISCITVGNAAPGTGLQEVFLTWRF